MRRFEEIPHTADWSFRAFGHDLVELFENAAFAFFALEGAAGTDAKDGTHNVTRTVNVNGIDYESLLVNRLSELLYLQESNREIYHRFHVQELSPTTLHAEIQGTPGIAIDKIIKAVTYHNLKIAQTPEGWEATVVVDV